MKLPHSLFQPSGFNKHFQGNSELPFFEYVEQTRHMIAQARADMTSQTAEKILNANAPYEWPSSGTAKKGLLLVHGLYDSPFMLKDIGDYLSRENFLVRSILLPGHGTIPGDLLNVHYDEWLKAVDYGVERLSKKVDQIFIVGFSLGGLLALYKSLVDTRIKGIVLISPALALRSQWLISQLVRWGKWIRWALPDKKWYKKRSFQRNYAKYESFTYNAATQIYQLVLNTHKLLKKNNLSIPVFLTFSTEDEVICPKACLSFFQSQTHPNNRLLCYARSPIDVQDSRIIIKNSSLPAQKILDYSHIGLSISPDNFHYGMQGDYKDFLIYPDNKPPMQEEIFLGAVSKNNLKKHAIQRLSYNPDFKGMMEEIKNYLKQCDS